LLLACALVAPWIRSYSVADVIDVPRPYLQHVVESRGGCVSWTAHAVLRSQWKFASHAVETRRYARVLDDSDLIDLPIWTISYWGLVLPLTAIAAALIVWPLWTRPPPAAVPPRRSLLQGWRRKLGYVTLTVTCGMLATWIQSHMHATVIDINNSHSLLLQDGSLRWATDNGYEGNPSTIHDWFDTLISNPHPDSHPLLYHWKQRWHRGWSALGWGYDTTGTLGVHWLQIHYLTIVPLLSCLSAWLILFPRRKPPTSVVDAVR
jgi:hypothetical protein